jgi:hypothetical protein
MKSFATPGFPSPRSPGAYEVGLARIARGHSNIANHWRAADGWPDSQQREDLRRHDRVSETTLDNLPPGNGDSEYALEPRMPGVVRLSLQPT